jgi:hypothetical protein
MVVSSVVVFQKSEAMLWGVFILLRNIRLLAFSSLACARKEDFFWREFLGI